MARVLLAFLFFSCFGTQKPSKTNESSFTCPKGFECTQEVLNNTEIQVNTNDFEPDKIYPFVQKGSQITIHVKMNEIFKQQVPDGYYSEDLLIELPKDFSVSPKTRYSLAEIPAFFGKTCFCQDSGFQRIKSGEIWFEQRSGKTFYQIELEPDASGKQFQSYWSEFKPAES